MLNLVPRSLVDEAEGEIWPNPICITWSLVRNVTGEANAHAQHKFGAVIKAKADFDAYNKLTTGLRHDLGIFARISKFHCFHETKQTQNEVESSFFNLAGFAFEYFSDSGRILATFSKFYLNSHVTSPWQTSIELATKRKFSGMSKNANKEHWTLLVLIIIILIELSWVHKQGVDYNCY